MYLFSCSGVGGLKHPDATAWNNGCGLYVSRHRDEQKHENKTVKKKLNTNRAVTQKSISEINLKNKIPVTKEGKTGRALFSWTCWNHIDILNGHSGTGSLSAGKIMFLVLHL